MTARTATKQPRIRQTLPPNVKAALEEFQQRTLELFPDDVLAIILYGSYARGDWRDESDVDVMEVVKWENEAAAGGRYLAWFGDPRWNRIMDVATDVLLDGGVHIAPLVMGETRWMAQKDDVLRQIEREGRTLWKTRQT